MYHSYPPLKGAMGDVKIPRLKGVQEMSNSPFERGSGDVKMHPSCPPLKGVQGMLKI